MNTLTLTSAMALLAGSLLAAGSSPKDEVTAAAKALGDKDNYSWKATVAVPPDARFRPGPTEGKTEKNGFTQVTITFNNNPMEIVRKGKHGAYLSRDGDWVTAAEAENNEGPGRFMAWFVRNLQTPSVQAAELASLTDKLAKEADVYSGDLTESGAKKLLSFRREEDDPNITNAKGSVKFWLKDGLISKYEFKLKGTVNWNGNNFDNDRTTTVEIKAVDRTKVDVPEGAKKKLS